MIAQASLSNHGLRGSQESRRLSVKSSAEASQVETTHVPTRKSKREGHGGRAGAMLPSRGDFQECSDSPPYFVLTNWPLPSFDDQAVCWGFAERSQTAKKKTEHEEVGHLSAHWLQGLDAICVTSEFQRVADHRDLHHKGFLDALLVRGNVLSLHHLSDGP